MVVLVVFIWVEITHLLSKQSVEFVTIPTAGNAIDFGDLITARYLNGGCSSRIRALSFGGNTHSVLNSIFSRHSHQQVILMILVIW